MARMIPETPGGLETNNAEREVFDRLRDETPPTWIACHHVGLVRHRSKPIAEADFVVISSLGVFCLEVKGGVVARRDGTWWAGSRALKESPFIQVGGAHGALRDAIPELARYLTGFGCVFPACVFRVEDPEVAQELVYDARDTLNTFEKYLERLATYWSGKYPGKGALSPQDIRRVAELIQPDYEAVESILPLANKAASQLLRFTEDQAKAVQGLETCPRVVVEGGAGTGKSLVAATEAVRHARQGHKTLLTCFNKALATELNERLPSERNLTIAHMDALITDLIESGGTADEIPADVSADDLFAYFRPEAAKDAIAKLGEQATFDCVVVDEGQDWLTETRVELLDVLLRDGLESGTWRIFWDPRQAIFSDAAPEVLWSVKNRINDAVTFRLHTNCRNTREIAGRTVVLSGIEAIEVAPVSGPDVVDREWESDKAHRKAVADVLTSWLSQGIPAEDIIVLSPRRFENSIVSTLPNIGIPVNDISGSPLSGLSSTIDFSTVHAFKGLEARAVLLVDIEEIESERSRMLAYVGASRARTILGVVRHRDTSEAMARGIYSQAVANANTGILAEALRNFG